MAEHFYLSGNDVEFLADSSAIRQSSALQEQVFFFFWNIVDHIHTGKIVRNRLSPGSARVRSGTTMGFAMQPAPASEGGAPLLF
jgi:hypothetical protein